MTSSTTTVTTSEITDIESSSTDVYTETMLAFPVISEIIEIETVRMYSIKRCIEKTVKSLAKATAMGNKTLVIKLTRRAKNAARNKKDALLKLGTARAQKKIVAKARITAKIGQKVAKTA